MVPLQMDLYHLRPEMCPPRRRGSLHTLIIQQCTVVYCGYDPAQGIFKLSYQTIINRWVPKMLLQKNKKLEIDLIMQT